MSDYMTAENETTADGNLNLHCMLVLRLGFQSRRIKAS
jgi:hypothetical protein